MQSSISLSGRVMGRRVIGFSDWLVVVVVVGQGAMGCGPRTSDGGDADMASVSTSHLRVEPLTATTTVTLGAASPQLVSYHAFLKDAAGVETEVTSTVTWTIDSTTIGSIAPSGKAFGIAGGATRVHAATQGLIANADLKVKLEGAVYGAGTDATTATRFGAATPDAMASNAAAIEYPEDGAVLPANLPPIEIQWSQAADSDTYRVHLVVDNVLDISAYSLARELALPAATWSLVRETTHDVPTRVTIEAIGAGNQLRTSAPRTFTVTADTIDQSAIYVWRSSTGSFRIIDLATAKDMPLPTTAPLLQEGQACSGCHRISRDGTRFGFTYTSDFNLGTLKYDEVTKTFKQTIAPSTSIRATYVAFDPNETMQMPGMVATVPDSVPQNTAGKVRLQMLSSDTGLPVASDIGAMIAKLPAATGRATMMPDWSADGSFVVFSAYDSDKSFVRLLGDDVVLASLYEAPVTFDGAMYHFGDPKPLVVTTDTDADSGQNNILPAISPEGDAVAFTRANGWWSVKTQQTLLNLSGQIMVVRRSDAHVFELAKGSLGSASLSSNTWAQWAPTPGARYAWIAYGSERAYGHELTPANHDCGGLVQGQASCKQLWVMAVDRAKLANGIVDPSSAPFWIPGQSIHEQYVSPQWTRAVVPVQ